MLSFMVLGALSHQAHIADVQRALAEGTRILAAFGVSGPYRIRFSSEHGTHRLKTVSLAVTAGNRKMYSVHMDRRTGRCLLVRRDDVDFDRKPGPRPNPAVVPELQQARVRDALLRLNWPSAKPPYLHEPFGTIDKIQAPLIVDRYPFVEDYRYDYHIRLDAETSAFMEFFKARATPEVERTTPKITADEALESARRFLVSDPPQTYDPQTRKMKSWTKYIVPAPKAGAGSKLRLAWYVPYEQTRAKLIWAVPYLTLYHSEYEPNPKGYAQTLYVDAVTGENIPPPPGRL